MGVTGIMIGIFGLMYGILSHRSARKLEQSLCNEKDLLKEKVLDIRQDWKDCLDRMLIDPKMREEGMSNTSDFKKWAEDMRGHIAILDRFVDRLGKLS